MKKSLLALSFLPLFSFAQMTSENEPSIGTTTSLYLCDSNTVLYENIIGTGVTWDYRLTMGAQQLTKTLTVEAVDPSTVDSIFVGATKKYSIETLLTTYFSSTATERISQGNVFSEPSLGPVFVNWNIDNQILNNYPFTLNDEVFDQVDGNIINTNPTALIDTVANGSSYSVIDGVGTLMLSSNHYTNVIRYNIKDTFYTTIYSAIFGEVAITLIRNRFEYYDYSTSNLPIFLAMSINLTSSRFNNSSTVILSKDPPLYCINLAENNIGTFNLYPNPADQVVNIEAACDYSYTVLNSKGEVLAGDSNKKSIDVTAFSPGIYFVKLQNDKGVQVEKFVKN